MSSADIDQVAQEILATLKKSGVAFSPSELINRLKEENGLSDTAVREAIWQLIDRTEILLTSDRKLIVRQESESASAP